MFLFLVLFIITDFAKCARILAIFPAPGYSQFILGEKLMVELSQNGHNVTVIGPYEPKTPIENYTTISTSGILQQYESVNWFQFESLTFVTSIMGSHKSGLKITEYTLANPKVQELLQSGVNFDLVIVEQFFCEALFGFAKHFNAPLVVFSSIGPSEWNNNQMGNPHLPSYMPMTKLTYNSQMNFYQRIKNTAAFLFDATYKRYVTYPIHDKLLKKYFPKSMDLEDVLYNASLMLLNSHYSITEPFPLVPGMVEIGGFHVSNSEALPKKLETFLDGAKDGAIYFSMGTNIKSSNLNPNLIQDIVDMFSQLKLKVLWKFDKTIPKLPPNVLVEKWFPQNAILGHVNTKLFISHCGLLSTTESVYFGVPMIAIPVFGDQKMNAAKAEHFGFALTIPYPLLSGETLRQGISEVLSDSKYVENVKLRSRLYHDRPVKPLDLAMFWIDFTIRNKNGTTLRFAGIELKWYQLYLLDITAFCVLIIIAMAIVGKYVIRKFNWKRLQTRMKLFLAIFQVIFVCNAKGAKILGVFPTPVRSHHILGHSLLSALAEKGHEVTLISPYEEKNGPGNKNYKHISLTGFDRKPIYINLKDSAFDIFLKLPLIKMIKFELAEDTLNHTNVQLLMDSDETFDVVIVEEFTEEALKALAVHFKAHLVVLSTVCSNPSVETSVGNPQPFSYVPYHLSSYSKSMTFHERVVNTLLHIYDQLLNHFYIYPKHEQVIKKYLPNAPPLKSIIYNSSIVLVNSHLSLNQPLPRVPNMIDIGGFHIKAPQKLPQDLEEFLDSAKDGAIYFSLGTFLQSSKLPAEKRNIFLKVFSKLKEKVLWKWEDDTLPGRPPNVKVAKWLPQQDILAHPNVKLFITHAGILSTTEAIYSGKPLLAIPVFGDQKTNAQNIHSNGFGLFLPYNNISEDDLTVKLNELLKNPKYARSARKRSEIFHDRLVKPMDTAIYWVEYVVRHGGAPHLRVAAVEFPWFKYFLVDVFVFIFVFIVLLFYMFYTSFKIFISVWTRNKQKLKQN